MADDRNHQPRVGLRGDTHVNGGMPRDDLRRIVISRVELRKVGDGPAERGDQERQQGKARPFRIHPRAQRLERGHVHFLDIGKMRDVPLRLLHRRRDPAPQSDHLDLLVARFGRRTNC
jgi:hypothetical protein